MPYYRKRRAQPKKAVYNRKRKFIRRKRRFVRRQNNRTKELGISFPATKLFKMRYVERISLTANAGVMQTYGFRASSIYDPNYTGTGHQPMGRDQIGLFYNRYLVVGSRITVTTNDSYQVGTALPYAYGIQLVNDLGNITAAWDTVKEQGRSVCKIRNTNFNTNRTVSMGYSLKKFFNISKVKDCQLTHGAHWDYNPTEQPLFVVFVQDEAKSGNQTVNLVVTIDYAVLCSEPNTLAAS